VKYAEASVVAIRVSYLPDSLQVDVTDNGVGFEPTAVATHEGGGFGLLNIRERLMHIGGELTIQSAPGQGTRSTLVVPVGESGS
jgi:signal transduction histidine kinase